MKQPKGFVQYGPEFVCKLHKSLYGLRQSARQWNKKLHSTLESLGYKCLESDRSIYLYRKDNVRIILPVFIDDITFAGNSQAAIDSAVTDLKKHFKLRVLGETKFLLGIAITRDQPTRSISLCQRQHIVDMLETFKYSDCNTVSTPMEPDLRLSKEQGAKTPEDVTFMQKVPYLSAVGSLMYLSLTTRPDIAYAVAVLARFSANPGVNHWKAVKHLFRYLQGTKDMKLVYRPDKSGEPFSSFTNTDHGGCKDSGRSTGGYLMRYGTGAISWSSKLQTIVALSTTEAEFVAAVEAGKEIVWLRSILREFGYATPSPSILRIDNQSAISVAKNPEHHGHMKHLNLCFYWLRDQVEAGVITPNFIPTKDMVADVLTKPLPRAGLENCRRLMGIE